MAQMVTAPVSPGKHARTAAGRRAAIRAPHGKLLWPDLPLAHTLHTVFPFHARTRGSSRKAGGPAFEPRGEPTIPRAGLTRRFEEPTAGMRFTPSIRSFPPRRPPMLHLQDRSYRLDGCLAQRNGPSGPLRASRVHRARRLETAYTQTGHLQPQSEALELFLVSQ
jgi:hypothetical protein